RCERSVSFRFSGFFLSACSVGLLISVYPFIRAWFSFHHILPNIDDLLKCRPSIRTGKKGDLRDFERGVVVGARRAGLSISETADLLGFSHTTISRVYRERSEKEGISSERSVVWTKTPC
uniref:Tc3 transposase DNA binding domain-containing protein n=1 Tax=Pygocentrus nattereri TaxID=42514 RepID=A0AAR2JRL1_PYGNA